jgi:hypothetical protein
VDVNQPAIVAGLRRAGATVEHLHSIGHGCPDIAVGFRGQTYLLEIKVERGALTPAETAWHATWRGSAAVVHTLEEALRVINAI